MTVERTTAAEVSDTTRPRISSFRIALLLFWSLALASLVVVDRIQQETKEAHQLQDRSVTRLLQEGDDHLENRRWEEAATSFEKLDEILPGNALSSLGRSKIAAGRLEEETQFLAYWSGQALAEFDAGKLDEAESALAKVLAIRPQHPEATDLRKQIASARLEMGIQAEIKRILSLVDQQSWDEAVTESLQLASRHPEHPDVSALTKQAASGRDLHRKNLARARTLYDLAKQRDTGTFDQQALDLLREASALSPNDAEIATLLARIAAYTRTLRVPGDLATLAEALQQTRDNDRILLGEGVWKGPLVIRHAVKIEGPGSTKTTLSCKAEEGNVLTITAGNVEISGLQIQHENLNSDTAERFSAVTVSGGSCNLFNCQIARSNGHGLAVLNGASATARRCQFLGNAWNGIAAIGAGTRLVIEDSTSSENFQNGVEAWQGAQAGILRCRIQNNSRNGIHFDQQNQPATCLDNQISGNREYGICLTSANGGQIARNQTGKNLLGGILIRKTSATVAVEKNDAKGNTGPDLILEAGLDAAAYSSNELSPGRRQAALEGVTFGP